MMERYLEQRESLRKVIQLVDIRHAPSKQDVEMYQYLRHFGLDGIVVATKADKISRNQLPKQIKLIRADARHCQSEDVVIPVSALKRIRISGAYLMTWKKYWRRRSNAVFGTHGYYL